MLTCYPQLNSTFGTKMWQSKEHLIVSMTGIAKAAHALVFSLALLV